MSLIRAKAKVMAAKKRLQGLYNEVIGVHEPPITKEEKAEIEAIYPLVSALNDTGNEITEIADGIISLVNDLRKEIL